MTCGPLYFFFIHTRGRSVTNVLLLRCVVEEPSTLFGKEGVIWAKASDHEQTKEEEYKKNSLTDKCKCYM